MSKKWGMAIHSGTWGTEQALSSNEQILIEGEWGLALGTPDGLPNRAIGQPIPKEPDMGNYTDLEGGFNGELRYLNLDEMFSGFFGEDRCTTVDTGAYRRELIWAEDTDGKFFTGAMDSEEHGIKSYPGIKVTGIDMTFETGKAATYSTKVIAAKPELSSTVNTQGVMNALAPLTRVLRILGHQCSFRINAQAGAALTSTDAVDADQVTVSLGRPHKPQFRLGSQSTQEPLQTDDPAVTVTVRVPKQVTGSLPNTKGFLAGCQAGTIYKAQLIATGALIVGTTYYGFELSFPALLLTKVKDSISSSFINECVLTFEASGATTAPTGMQSADGYTGGILEPVRLRITNTNSADYIA